MTCITTCVKIEGKINIKGDNVHFLYIKSLVLGPGLYISNFPVQDNARSYIADNILDIILVSIRQNIQY